MEPINEITGLDEEENEITIILDNNLDNCEYMFLYLENLIEVDLTNFNA